MNTRLRLKPSHALITIMLFLAIGLYSCGKDADPSVIKVSSTPISGLTPTTPTTGGGSGTGSGTGTGNGSGSSSGTGSTMINSNGDGGVAIGDAGTIIFTLKGKTYTLSNKGSYIVNIATLTIANTTISQVLGADSPATNDIQFSLAAQTAAAGVYDAAGCVITLADGTSYKLQTAPVGKINFNTYAKGTYAVTSRGTFDVILANTQNSSDIQRVSGSFNIQ